MKTKQSIVFVVDPHDVLTDQLQSIKGGNTTSTTIKCTPEGYIVCKPRGKIKTSQSISAWS